MARPLRIQPDGAVHHVTVRTNDGMALFEADAERRLFLGLLRNTISEYRWTCRSYCLMANHVHLLVQPDRATLSAGMQRLATRYARYYNDRRGRYGHVFQGRYGSRVVAGERYLREVMRYIALNPVRAGLCSSALAYPWSAHRALMGVARSELVAVNSALEVFGSSPPEARAAYGAYVADRADDQRFAVVYEGGGPSDDQLAALTRGLEPDALILRAHLDHGYSFAAIGRALGRHRSSVARRFARLRG